MKFEIKKEGKRLRVWNNEKSVYITKDLPSMKIAQEICDDFNAMANKDYRPIGMPDFSKRHN